MKLGNNLAYHLERDGIGEMASTLSRREYESTCPRVSDMLIQLLWISLQKSRPLSGILIKAGKNGSWR